MELSETFYMSVLASGCAILALIIKRMSASKCDEISCFILHIHRRVELEENITDEEKGDTISPNSIRPSIS